MEEKSLALQSNMSLGQIETNALKIKEQVAIILEEYSNKKYSEDSLPVAKEDRATLNKAEARLKKDFKVIKEKWMEPLEKLNSIIVDITRDISNVNQNIDAFVKTCETKEKEAKKALINDYFQKEKKDRDSILELSDVFDEKWLNKTVTEKSIKACIDSCFDKEKQEMGLINQHESKDLLMAIYAKEKDYLRTMNVFNEHIALAQAGEAMRKYQENQQTTSGEPQEAIQEEPRQQQVFESPVKDQGVKLFKRIFIIEGRKDQMIAIHNYIQSLGVNFEVK
jgi:esterase/lipase